MSAVCAGKRRTMRGKTRGQLAAVGLILAGSLAPPTGAGEGQAPAKTVVPAVRSSGPKDALPNPAPAGETSANRTRPSSLRSRSGKVVLPPPRAEAGLVEVRLFDGSNVRVKLLDEKLPFDSPYGRLLIPCAEIRQIEFGLRLRPQTRQKIAAAIEQLGDPDFDRREAAMMELAGYRQRALRALEQGTHHADVEVVYRCELLLEAFRRQLPKDLQSVHDDDVLQAGQSRIVGKLAVEKLRVATGSFGEQQIDLHDLASVRALGAAAASDEGVLPAPVSLTVYQNQIGKSFLFRVTGSLAGSVWGTGVYTLDSPLGAAAVHAGVLKPDETDVVRVTILPSPPAFTGSAANGVQSTSFGPFPAAYSVERP